MTLIAAAARRSSLPLAAMPSRRVAQHVDARLQVGHPHPQRLVFVQRMAELASFHHAGQVIPMTRWHEEAIWPAIDIRSWASPQEMAASPVPATGDQRIGGHPGVDVHGRGVQRPGADLAVRRLNLDLRGRYRDHDHAAVPAGQSRGRRCGPPP